MSGPRESVKAWLDGASELAPITELLGISPVTVGEGQAVVKMAADSRHHNAMGTVHGGIFCDLADVAMGVALATVLEDGESFTTLGLNASYFRAVRETTLEARARVVRRGKSSAFVECDLYDSQEHLVARLSSSCLFFVYSRG